VDSEVMLGLLKRKDGCLRKEEADLVVINPGQHPAAEVIETTAAAPGKQRCRRWRHHAAQRYGGNWLRA
jgi:hypothetical protein